MKTNTQNIVRKIFFLFSILFFLNGNAQAPNKFSFQAVVRNTSNQLITNQSVGVKISLISVVMGTENAEFEETHTATTNANGLFSLKVGEGTLISGDFETAMNSSAYSKKIKCEIDPTGGTNYTIVSNEQLLSVPYALKANKATFANNANYATTATTAETATIATTATTATTANSVNGIAGTEGYLSVFGANNAIGSSILYQDDNAGNIGIWTQTPIADLDVAGNGTILARKRVVLGPVGGNPATDPVWAVDNFNNEFRIFKQPNIYNSGNTYFSIAPTGNVNMTNNLNVTGDIATNKITAGNNSSLGANSSIGSNLNLNGSVSENLTVLHISGPEQWDYLVTNSDRNIVIIHDDSDKGKKILILPVGSNVPNGRKLDVKLILHNYNDFLPEGITQIYVDFTNVLPSANTISMGNLVGNKLGAYKDTWGNFYVTQIRELITHVTLIYSSELNSWIVLDSNFFAHTITQ